MKKELGCCTRRFSLHFLLSSSGLGCSKSLANGILARAVSGTEWENVMVYYYYKNSKKKKNIKTISQINKT